MDDRAAQPAGDAADVVIVGAGAAGLATAIFSRRAPLPPGVVLLDGAAKPGAKILISGGSRCNVTNTVVSEADFSGGRSAIVRKILRAFPIPDTIAFFGELGVPLHEEPDGKLFPNSNRSRDVLEALTREVNRVGATLRADHRVTAIDPTSAGFRVTTSRGEFPARAVVLAAGGQSLPKTGSDGFGFAVARRLGHTIVPPTPALAPLLLDARDPQAIFRELSGVSHLSELTVWADGGVMVRVTGSLLWTHFGVSGPATLDASRHWARAQLEGRSPAVTLNFCPADSFDAVDSRWTQLGSARPHTSVHTALSGMVPAAVSEVLLQRLGIDRGVELAHFQRDDRRRLARALTEWPLPVVDTRGYNYAEATAGGVALTEIDPSTMQSRVCPGLYLVGEVLDVDGRIGGFNFQWAWSTARIAGRALHQDGSR